MWERGLKYKDWETRLEVPLSFPLWERGLKSIPDDEEEAVRPSFPLWERGLKFPACVRLYLHYCVVPLVGTWIEMSSDFIIVFNFVVVPLVGTWIEMPLGFMTYHAIRVVPLVGTWIEIIKDATFKVTIASFPLWERGLKSCLF